MWEIYSETRPIIFSVAHPWNEEDGSDGDYEEACRWLPSSLVAAMDAALSEFGDGSDIRSSTHAVHGSSNAAAPIRIGDGSDLLSSTAFVEYYKNFAGINLVADYLGRVHCFSHPGCLINRKCNSWIEGEWLGSGTFGTVCKGIADDGLIFAVKLVPLSGQGGLGKDSLLQLQQEIALLSRFEHENIVQYLGTDKDKERLYVFLEFMPKGSLSSLYDKDGFTESEVPIITWQLLNGLEYLHYQNVIHRDIKCDNILVAANGSVKLADFGLAKDTEINAAKSFKGTPLWMAPEVFNNANNGYGLPADIWSLGCTVLEMSTGKRPYSNLAPMDAWLELRKGEPPQVPKSLPRDARDFICKCLQVNPNDRPTAAELLDHPFVRKPPTSN